MLEGDLKRLLLLSHITEDAVQDAGAVDRPIAPKSSVPSCNLCRYLAAPNLALCPHQGWIECVQALHAARWTGNHQAAATLSRLQHAGKHWPIASGWSRSAACGRCSSHENN